MEGAALIALRKDPKTHPQLLYFGSWYQDYPDPQNWLSAVLTCDSSLNQFSYCNEEFDKLTKQGDTTIDPAERLTYYQQASQLLVDDLPAIFLAQSLRHLCRQPGGQWLHPDAERGGMARERLIVDDDRQGRGASGAASRPAAPADAAAVAGSAGRRRTGCGRTKRARGAGRRPADPLDADGDGLEDAIEVELGTDPYDRRYGRRRRDGWR